MKNQKWNLWYKQGGKCPICGEGITRETPAPIHHTLPRSLGGTDALSNLVILHVNCHRQVHSRSNRRGQLLSKGA
ncbi:HNH endonuclease [Methylothermus subterraneus]